MPKGREQKVKNVKVGVVDWRIINAVNCVCFMLVWRSHQTAASAFSVPTVSPRRRRFGDATTTAKRSAMRVVSTTNFTGYVIYSLRTNQANMADSVRYKYIRQTAVLVHSAFARGPVTLKCSFDLMIPSRGSFRPCLTQFFGIQEHLDSAICKMYNIQICPSVRPSVCLSCLYSVETAEHIITR